MDTVIEWNEERLSNVYYPWRRFFARMLDFEIYQVIYLLFLWTAQIKYEGTMLEIFGEITQLGLTILVEPILLCIWGTTPGKAIFGLEIRDFQGNKLCYKDAVDRTAYVITKGMGVQIPFIRLIMLWKAYKKCSDCETLPWDADINYTIRDTKEYRSFLCVSVYVLCMLMPAFINTMLLIPPNRGTLTVEEFAENYNYYQAYFKQVEPCLDSDGNWISPKDKMPIRFYDIRNYMEFEGEFEMRFMPDFVYETEDGRIKSITVEGCRNDDVICVTLASVAYAGAKTNVTSMKTVCRGVVETIQNTGLEDVYEFECSGLIFANTVYTDDHGENYISHRREYTITLTLETEK